MDNENCDLIRLLKDYYTPRYEEQYKYRIFTLNLIGE
jgi:hypothetical protein